MNSSHREAYSKTLDYRQINLIDRIIFIITFIKIFVKLCTTNVLKG